MSTGLACPDSNFIYTVKLNGLTTYPSWFSWNQNTMVMSWGTVTNALVGTYLIEVLGSVNDGNFQTKSFYLDIVKNCDVAILLPTWQPYYKYYIDTANPFLLPFSVVFDVTSDLSAAQCGAFSYQLS